MKKNLLKKQLFVGGLVAATVLSFAGDAQAKVWFDHNGINDVAIETSQATGSVVTDINLTHQNLDINGNVEGSFHPVGEDENCEISADKLTIGQIAAVKDILVANDKAIEGKAKDALDAADAANTKADAANTKADAANTKADAANTKADAANTKADAANTKADAANTKADAANTKADAANTKADAANTKADAANTKADAANTKADAANTKADAANTKADAANTKADAANTKADAANTKADAANTKADAANTKADAANTKADAANTKADAANTKADAANAKADAANTKADAANTKADSALEQIAQEVEDRKAADAVLDGKIEAETERATREEKRIEDKFDKEVSRLDNKIDKLDDRIEKVGAMSAAIANLHTMGYDPAAPTEIAVGVGQYRDKTGLAVGAFHYPNRDFMMSFSVSTAGDEFMAGIGATWKIGRKSPEQMLKAQQEKAAREKLAEAEAMKQAAKDARVAAQQARHAKMLAERSK